MSVQPAHDPIRSEFADDPDMAELVEMFVADLPDRVAALRDAFDHHHFDELKRLAHQLKGASPGYGFPAIGSAAALLERQLADLQPPPDDTTLSAITDQVRQLIDLCSRATA